MSRATLDSSSGDICNSSSKGYVSSASMSAWPLRLSAARPLPSTTAATLRRSTGMSNGLRWYTAEE